MLYSIAFIGSGQMATALAKGWLSSGLMNGAASAASDPVPAAREAFANFTGIRTAASNLEILPTEIVLLAIKPQMMADVLAEIRSLITANTLVISIAAGITLSSLEAGLGAVPIVRVMPNTPCLVGASASAYCANTHASAAQRLVVAELFGAVGLAMELPEKHLDAVTGLSGSGPAFVFVMIEALADGGVRAGLPRDAALKLAAQTVLGSARMLLETGRHPGALKDAVASPGGTTIAGLHALEKAGVRGAFMDAVATATARATELGATASLK
jgi:pyrroline-5-carboxylate reductase